MNVEYTYHECNKTALPSLGAVQVHVVMHHTKPCRLLLKNIFLVSSALTCGIPFQTAGHELDSFVQEVDHWPQGDAQALSILQFYYPVVLTHNLWVCHLLLQREIMVEIDSWTVVVVAHNTKHKGFDLSYIFIITQPPEHIYKI